MLKNAPQLRTIALAVALCAMSMTLGATSVQASGKDCGSQKHAGDNDQSSSGGSLSYLNALGKHSGHHKKHACNKSGSAGFATISDNISTSSSAPGYKLAPGNGAGSNSKPVSNSKKNSSSNSGSGNIPGLGNFLKGKFDSGSNSSNGSGAGSIGFGAGTQPATNSNNKSNSGGNSGSGSFGFGFGLGNLFGGGGNNSSSSSSQTGSASGSSGFGLGSLFGSNSGSNSNSNSGTGTGSNSGSSSASGSSSGTGSGTGLGLLPSPGTGSNSASNSNNPIKLPNILKPVKPLPVKQASVPTLTPADIIGRQVDYSEYQKRLQRWAATGSGLAGGGSGSTTTPRIPFITAIGSAAGGGAGNSSSSSNGGGGGGGGAGGSSMFFDPTTSAQYAQQMWDKANQRSAKCDASQQRQSCGDNPSEIYMSLPSADRTMRQVFVVEVAGQSEDKKNASGGSCGDKGDSANADELDAKSPAAPITAHDEETSAQQNRQEFTQEVMSPQAQGKAAKAGAQSQCQGAGEACAKGTCEGLEQALMVMFMPMSTVNVANEAAGTPGSTLTPFRPLSQAIWMVQKMYKQVYMPMALLLLLPGAVILNIKVMLHSGINHGSDEDTTSPFAGIMRSMIAVFLIPATQLIVSYAADIGSSMTHEVAGATKVMALVAWAKTAMGDSMTPLNGQETGLSNMKAGKALFAAVMHTVSMTLAYGLLMLIAFQITIMCYLMCMGPIAAAFYVWPTGVGRLFKPVFANWVDAVINIALWKFWWCVIVLCMVTRINLMTFVDVNPEWEAYMFVCFLVMMSYVPFAPFECKPGEMVDKILQKAQELKKSAGDQG